MRHRTLFALILLSATVAGCVAAGSAHRLPRAVRESRARLRTETYRVIGTGLGAQGDGYTFLSERFRFSFAKAFDEIKGFRTPEERFARGKRANEILNGGYEFVRDLFGLEAKRRIDVVISPALDGDPGDARTELEWRTFEGKIVDGSEKVTIYFGEKAFLDAPTLVHELTHALLGVYALPAWLSEGMAVLVETDFAKGTRGDPQTRSLEPIGLDEEGYNLIQSWRGDGNPLPFRSAETYGYAYAIVKEIQRRYGKDVFVRLFQYFAETKPHLRGERLRTSDIIAGLNRVTGQQTRPFFEELRFRID